MSAGAVNTPQLLMLSGIGDKTQLSKFKIKTIINSPNVGKNMQDHVVLPNVWSVNAAFTYDDVARNASIAQAYLAQWIAKKTGPFATAPNEEIGWFRLPRNASIFDTVRDPSSGSYSPHYEFIFAVRHSSTLLHLENLLKYFSVLVGVLRFFRRAEAGNWALHDDCLEPHHSYFAYISHRISTAYDTGSDARSIVGGTVTLRSENPWQAPLIDPALLSTDFDIFAIREAIKAAQRFAASPGWDGYVIGPFGDLATARTDAEIEAYARRNAATVFHPVGTAAMGPKHSSTGVVDPHFVVKGAVGLRVVDASVFVGFPSWGMLLHAH